MRKILPYNKKLLSLARKLRQNSTLAEILLWNQLKNKQILNYDFDRQKVIDNYIVDFFCKELSLVIEIDGQSHGYKVLNDEKRQKKLESLGTKFLRFSDSQVKQDMDSVVRSIESWIKDNR